MSASTTSVHSPPTSLVVQRTIWPGPHWPPRFDVRCHPSGLFQAAKTVSVPPLVEERRIGRASRCAVAQEPEEKYAHRLGSPRLFSRTRARYTSCPVQWSVGWARPTGGRDDRDSARGRTHLRAGPPAEP